MVPGITHIFVQNYVEQCLKNVLEMKELTDIILYFLLMHMRNNGYNILMAIVVMVVIQYH